jgi:hypothetical protein
MQSAPFRRTRGDRALAGVLAPVPHQDHQAMQIAVNLALSADQDAFARRQAAGHGPAGQRAALRPAAGQCTRHT